MNRMMTSVANLTLTSCCFLFISLLAIMYFSKKNMKNLENKIYRFILIWSILNLIFYLGTSIPSFVNKAFADAHHLSLYGARLTGLATVMWFAYFALYIQVICKQNRKKKSKILFSKYSYPIIQLFIIFLGALSFKFELGYLPDKNGEMLVGGNAAIYYWMESTACVLISILTLLTHLKGVPFKKVFPLLIITFLLPASLVANGMISLFILPLAMTVVSYLMYFTIENPDLKLITELELAKSQAEQASNAKSDFLSSMSHELRTPLNAIVGLSHMINKNQNLNEIHTDSEDIIIASENLLELVNGILDINMLETNQIELIEDNYKPADMLNELVKMIEIRIRDKNLTLNTEFSENLPEYLYGDKEKVKRIISNLLTNAVKYTDSGSIDFKLECNQVKDKYNLKFTVKDTGRGISEDRIPQLFTKFNRLESDKNGNIQGTGLGLAITKSLVDLLGGKINVTSTEGVETIFTVTITQKIGEKPKNVENEEEPVRNEVQTATVENNVNVENSITTQEPVQEEINESTTEQVETQNTASNTGKKVLIVDDNNLNLKVASRMLKNYNFDVETSNSGFECIDKINGNNKYDLVFMDIMMPEMDGVQTMKKLKGMSYGSPIVALTADAVEGSKDRYIREGFDDYIAKPLNNVSLEQTLSKVLDNKIVKEQPEEENKENVSENTQEEIEML